MAVERIGAAKEGDNCDLSKSLDGDKPCNGTNAGLSEPCEKSADFDDALTEAVITYLASLYDCGYFS